MTQDATTQDAEQDEEQESVWVNQAPTTTVSGVARELIYSGELSERVAQNGTSFGVLFTDFQVEDGELYRNQNKVDGGVTVVDEETGKRATDYRAVDLTDQKISTTEINGETFVTDRAGQSFESVEDLDGDDNEVIVWYNGMSGQVISRALDFNGRPFAEYKQDGYLLKGLYQVANGWRDGDKGDMVKSGLGPRVARAPLLREDVQDERISITIGRWNGGNMYEATVEDADGEELDMLYDENADDVLDEVEYGMHLHHGEGWQDEPANAQKPARSFDITADAVEGGDGDGELTPVEQNFVDNVTDAVIETGLRDADDAFTGGISGLMNQHGVDGDAAELRSIINDRVAEHYGEEQE